MQDRRPPPERRVADGMALAWSVVVMSFGLLGRLLLPLLVAGAQRGYCENLLDHPGRSMAAHPRDAARRAVT